MKTANMPKTLGERGARAAALCLLALAAVLLQGRDARAQWTTSGTTTTTTNNVGVGTAAPPGKFAVTGSDAVPDDTVTLTVPSASVFGPSLKLDGRGSAGGRVWTIASTGVNNSGGAGKLRFYDMTADAVRMILDGSGNLGIGTTAPQSLLDISGSSGMTLRNTNGSSGFSFFDRPTVPGDQVVFQGNAGNYSLFNVATRGANFGAERASGMAFWTVDIANSPNATMFQFQYTTAFGPVFFTQKFGTGAQGDKKISFQTAWQNTASVPSQLVLDTTGYVGIGTATPAAKLDVAGDIRVSGNINAKYQDVAEWVPTTQRLAAGTVVVLDAGRANHVSASTYAYDTAVAGVVSARPGLTLGEAGEGKALVATTGRVKVRVDARRAPIRIGDLLVTSDVEGFAMKSEPVAVGGRRMHAPGTIIGKALESLDRGTGEILVLLSLQ